MVQGVNPFLKQPTFGTKQLSFGQGAQRPQGQTGVDAGASQAAFAAGMPKFQPQQFGVTPVSNTKGVNATNVNFQGGDQLAQFKSQLASGQIKTNLNQPALPYYANQGWTA
jgi:hypothetical protein